MALLVIVIELIEIALHWMLLSLLYQVTFSFHEKCQGFYHWISAIVQYD